MTLIATLASNLGCEEAGLKLLLGQLSGYPLFLLHGQLLKKSSSLVQHLFFALSGMIIGSWATGVEAWIHACTCILVTFLTLKIFNGSFASTVFLFLFNFLYLLVGYYFEVREDYVIDWKIPHCVLCLRLIGLTMDVYDGQMPKDKLSKDQLNAALVNPPSILEMLSHSFFVGGFFVGPQFSMRKYQAFIKRNIEEDIQPPILFGFRRLLIGLTYLVVNLVGLQYIPENFVEQEAYLNMDCLLWRLFYISLWTKIMTTRYIALWLIAEGTLIVSGLAYNGKDSKGEILWNGGANVKLRLYEGATRFQHLIDSFNINTNFWVLCYIYKRLRFLNNRLLSQAGALLFLALWHGFHSGYYMMFFNEFIVVNFEKEFFPILDKSSWLQSLQQSNPAVNAICWMCGKIYYLFVTPLCFFPFALLKSHRYMPVLASTNYILYIFCASFLIWKPLAKWILKPIKPEEKPKSQ